MSSADRVNPENQSIRRDFRVQEYWVRNGPLLSSVPVVRWRWTAFLSLVLLVSAGCGYRIASKNRLDSRVKSIAVRPLENQTTTYEVEQILTRALISEFVERSDFEVMNEPGRADAVLDGTIQRLTVNPVTFGQTAFASTFLITVYARVAMTERATGKVLFRNNNYIFREQYVINVDIDNFFSESNPALDRIAADFASSVVTSVLEFY